MQRGRVGLLGLPAVAGVGQVAAGHCYAFPAARSDFRRPLGGGSYVPGGVSATGDDNIVYDIDAAGTSAGGFGQPHCADATTESTIAADLPVTFPVGAAE